MVRLECDFETESKGSGDIKGSRRKRSRCLRTCSGSCSGSCSRSEKSEVTGRIAKVTRASCATFCERKGYVFVGYEDGTLTLWSGYEGEILRSFRGHESEVGGVAMSADGKCVVSGSEDKSVRVWDVETGAQLVDEETGHTRMVISVAMNADRRHVVPFWLVQF